jgi:hypothetical protein
MMPIKKVTPASRIKILIVSNTKKLSASPNLLWFAIPKTEYISQSANVCTQSNMIIDLD